MTLCSHFEENREVIEFLQGPDDHILASLPSQNFIDGTLQMKLDTLLTLVDELLQNWRRYYMLKVNSHCTRCDASRYIALRRVASYTFFKFTLSKRHLLF